VVVLAVLDSPSGGFMSSALEEGVAGMLLKVEKVG
jgi:hypothetical protein